MIKKRRNGYGRWSYEDYLSTKAPKAKKAPLQGLMGYLGNKVFLKMRISRLVVKTIIVVTWFLFFFTNLGRSYYRQFFYQLSFVPFRYLNRAFVISHKYMVSFYPLYIIKIN